MNIDIQKLAENLADTWFESEVVPYTPESLLYDTEIEDEGSGMSVKLVLNSSFATKFWDKVEEFKQLIEEFEIK